MGQIAQYDYRFGSLNTAIGMRSVKITDGDVDSNALRLSVIRGSVDEGAKVRNSLIGIAQKISPGSMKLGSDRRKSFVAPAHALGFIPRGQDIEVESENPGPVVLAELGGELETSLFDAAEVNDAKRQEAILYISDRPMACLGQLFIDMSESGKAFQVHADQLMMEALTLGICARFVGKVAAKDGDADAEVASWANRRDDERLARALDCAESRLGDNSLRVDDMASAAGVSPAHFSEIFRSWKGVTPYAFIVGRRIDMACAALTGTAVGIAQIAHDCGFSSQSHMTTAFKKKLGFTPGDVRSSHR